MLDPIPRVSDAGFIEELDAIIARHAMLEHPFYKAWNEGALTREMLADYAKQYYAHVSNFPIYISATHSRCDDIKVRQLLLENLNDEEKGEENHPELWMRFAEGLGLGRAEVEAAELLPETKASVATIKSLTEDPDCLSGIAALYAYESQIPEVAGTKREGLKAFYGIDDARTVSFFTVHEQADLVHRRLERDILREKAADSASRHRKSCVRPMRRRRRSGRFSMASTGRSFQRSSGTSTGGVFYRGEL